MTKIQKASFILIGLTTVLAGCSNAPKSTQASVPLVHSSLAYSLSADQNEVIKDPVLNSSFNNIKNISITYGGHQYNATKHYLSATGNDCIRFQLSKADASNARKRFTACKRKGQWTVISPLVVSTEEQGE